ncbi:MAG: hypothetical protein WC326_14130 [Candidatus Delongbacteria bacterium]
MNNRAVRILLGGSILLLVAGLFLWRTTAANPDISTPVLLPVILAAILAGAMLLWSVKHDRRKRLRDRPETRARRQLGALVGGCVAVGALVWDRLHAPGQALAGSDGSRGSWLVLGAILLLAAVMVIVKRLQRDRDRQAR